MIENDPETTPLLPETSLEKEVNGQKPNRVNPLSDFEENNVPRRRYMQGKGKETRVSKRYDGRAARRHRPTLERVLHDFYIEVDLPEFKKALDFSKDPKFQMLLLAMSNPNLAKCGFPELCKRCNLSINDIAGIWRNYQLNQGMFRMMNHMPQVMEDIAIDSQSKMVRCERCEGTGKIEGGPNRQKEAICPKCHGDGEVRILGDKDARQLLFESAGLKKGAQQNQVVQVNLGSQLPSLEDEVASVEKAFDVGFTEVMNDNLSDREGKTEETGPETGSDSADPGSETSPSAGGDAPSGD